MKKKTNCEHSLFPLAIAIPLKTFTNHSLVWRHPQQVIMVVNHLYNLKISDNAYQQHNASINDAGQLDYVLAEIQKISFYYEANKICALKSLPQRRFRALQRKMLYHTCSNYNFIPFLPVPSL